MNKYLNVIMLSVLATLFIGCGEEEKSFSSQTVTEKAPINTEAVTFPELPTMDNPTSTIKIETH